MQKCITLSDKAATAVDKAEGKHIIYNAKPNTPVTVHGDLVPLRHRAASTGAHGATLSCVAGGCAKGIEWRTLVWNGLPRTL